MENGWSTNLDGACPCPGHTHRILAKYSVLQEAISANPRYALKTLLTKKYLVVF